jgi:hypothetical protein
VTILKIATPQAPPGAFGGPREGGPDPKNPPSKRKQVEPQA